MKKMKRTAISRKGDTLVEVMFAVGIFGMIAIGAVALMNHGLDVGQNTLEVTMARQEIDAQITALRFIHDAYTSEAKQNDSTYRGIWNTLTTYAYKSDDGVGGILGEDSEFYDRTIENNQTCEEIYGDDIPSKSFIVNPRKLDANVADTDTIVYHDDEAVATISSAAVYPRLLYGSIDSESLSDATIEDTSINIHDDSSLVSAEGIWAIAVASDSVANGEPDFYDFYIHTCWDRVGDNGSTSINSVIRLYNPKQIVLDNRVEVNGYSLYYDANGGSGAPDADNFDDITYPNHKFTIKSEIPVKTDHRFIGWARRPEGSTDCSDAYNALYHPNKENMEKEITVFQYKTTLCAVWEKNWVYQLDIRADGSNSSERTILTSDRTFDTSHTFLIENTTSHPLTVAREGYIFLGWSDNPSGEASYSLGDSVTLDYPITSKTIYGQWQKTSNTCTRAYRLQNADGTYPETYTEDWSSEVEYGDLCEYTKEMSSYVTKSTSETMGLSPKTIYLDLPRQTYSLTVNRDTTYISSVSGAGTYRWGQTVSISATATSGHDFAEWSQTAGTTGSFGNTNKASTTFTMGKGNATVYASGKKGTFECSKQYRLQNADGSYPTSYTADGSESIRSGSTCTYSKTVSYYTTKSTTGTVNGSDITLSLDLPRTTYTCSKQYRLQEADGSYPTSYTADGSTAVRWGATCTYEKSVSYYQTKSTSATMGKENKTLSLSLPRNTYTCSKQYRLQKADGTYPDSYTADGSTTLRWGETCSYEKSATNYQTKSTSATMGKADKTVSVSLPRNTFKLTVNRNTTYVSSVTGAGTYRWGQAVSISATVATNATFAGWTQKEGTSSTFGDASKASTTFTMPKSAATIYADAKIYMQSFTNTMCSSCTKSACIVYDQRDGKQYKVMQFDGVDGPTCVMVSDLKYADLAHRTSNGTYLYTWYVAQNACPNKWKLATSGVRDGSTAGSYTFAKTIVYNLDSKTLVTYPTNATCTPNDDRAYTRWCTKGGPDCEWRCPLKANQDYTVRCTRR